MIIIALRTSKKSKGIKRRRQQADRKALIFNAGKWTTDPLETHSDWHKMQHRVRDSICSDKKQGKFFNDLLQQFPFEIKTTKL